MILRKVDAFLNSITMYRVVLYGLALLALISIIFGFLAVIPYPSIQLLQSLAIVIAVCYAANMFFSRLFSAPTNVESLYITAFILFFVLNPADSVNDAIFLAEVSVFAMASKYLMAIHKKHIFNPVAISVALFGTLGLGAGSWWISHPALFPFVTVVGLLIVRKIRRFHLFLSFLAVATVTVTFINLKNGMTIDRAFMQVFTAWPTIFFGTVMLTEPLTTPPTARLQMMYGALVGLLFGIPFSFGRFYLSQETALVIGNVFSFIVSPKRKLFLKLKEKIQLTPDMWEFVFSPGGTFKFTPGQYMEWTLSHKKSDSRGNRRYFTIASAPTGPDVRLGVKVTPDHSSSFKHSLASLNKNDTIVASQLSGDFTLPENQSKKLVFIAGGIGITPFRSMTQYLLDTHQTRDAVLFYSAPSTTEFAYKDFFDGAESKSGVKMVYIITKQQNVPKNWSGKTGYMTDEIVQKEVPDFKDRTFYLSGPISMVDSYKALLKKLGVPKNKIITDYFPGF